jgi:hypothetical protein
VPVKDGALGLEFELAPGCELVGGRMKDHCNELRKITYLIQHSTILLISRLVLPGAQLFVASLIPRAIV